MTLRDKLMIYVYRKMNELELDKDTLTKMKYQRVMDSLDYYELMRADIRVQCWNEFLKDIYNIVINGK